MTKSTDAKANAINVQDKKPQTIDVVQDRRVFLDLPMGETLVVKYAKVGRKHYLTLYPRLVKTEVEIYGNVPGSLRTQLGQKIDNYQMMPLTEKDFA